MVLNTWVDRRREGAKALQVRLGKLKSTAAKNAFLERNVHGGVSWKTFFFKILLPAHDISTGSGKLFSRGQSVTTPRKLIFACYDDVPTQKHMCDM